MHRKNALTVLTLAIALALAGCGNDEPEVSTADAPSEVAPPKSTAATQSAPAVAPKPPEPKLPVAASAYERAQRALTQIPGMRLETEFTAPGGTTQYLTGSRQLTKYAFAIRTLPEPDNAVDGSWMFQSGRFMKQQGQSYDQAVNAPGAITAFLNAVASLPDEESELSPERGALDNAGGVNCQPRAIDLSKSRLAAQSFSRLVVCVDESSALIVKLTAETRIGEKLVAMLSGYGEAIELPQTAEVKSWDQQYPRR